MNVRNPAKQPRLAQENWETPPGGPGAAYLKIAIKLRDMSARARSPDTRREFMRLAVLYEELAEYAATTRVTSLTAGQRRMIVAKTLCRLTLQARRTTRHDVTQAPDRVAAV